MNRRGFLRLFGASAAVLAADPERLLWVPGQKLISIPSPIIAPTIDDYAAFYADTMLPALREVIDRGYRARPPQFSQVFNMNSSSRSIKQFSQVKRTIANCK